MEEGVKEPQKKASPGQIVLNVLGIILCVIFIPIIIMNVVLIVKSYTQPDEIPSVFGVSPIIVLSGSMSPEFEVGEMIFIQKADPYTLKEGDVITYLAEEGESAVTHRIVEIQQQGGQLAFVTQGDANNTADTMTVKADEVKGKYLGVHIPKLGDLAVFMQSTMGMVIFIVGPLLLIVLWDVLRRALASRKDMGKSQQLQQETERMQQELERLRAQVGETPKPSVLQDPASSGRNDQL